MLLSQSDMKHHDNERALQTRSTRPTLWGLTAEELHDRFWAARGVQVVRQGQASEVVDGAELFLLTDPKLLTIFRLRPFTEEMAWIEPKFMVIRLHDDRERAYREVALSDQDGRFQGFQRDYGVRNSLLSRVALTPDRELARQWQNATDARSAWRMLRHRGPKNQSIVRSGTARVYDNQHDEQIVEFLRELIQRWPQPTSTVERARKLRADAFGDPSTEIDPLAQLIGPLWIGAGRSINAQDTVVGPAVLWDDPEVKPQVEHVRWDEIMPSTSKFSDGSSRIRTGKPIYKVAKRLFDLTVCLLAMILFALLFPLIMLAIWIEDGRPFFFAHQRETMGGREFPCLKFRSMRKDAEAIKQRIMRENQVDGPQFYIENDPRITRIGRILRGTQLDELPQLINVLLGHMSIVGPRPSPHKENQYCPPWREARLSVRPGITGLWQVKRTRQEGLDFQEWIRFDIEYVEKASFWLDLKIIFETFTVIFKKFR